MQHPYVNIAINAARAAGQVIARTIEESDKFKPQEKSTNDFVTEVDKACEEIIVDIIQKAYPRHSIVGEEQGEIARGGDVEWVIDPLDGTLNFIHGFPQVAISIAVRQNNKVEHGVVFDPLRQELFSATRGSGAQLNGRRIRVSRTYQFSRALLATGFPVRSEDSVKERYVEQFKRVLLGCSDVRRAGSAALDLAYVAMGRLDGYWEDRLQSWDVAAGSLLVSEAGGYVSDFSAGDGFVEKGQIIAANSKIHPELLAYLKESN